MLYEKISFTGFPTKRESSDRLEESSGLFVYHKDGRCIATLDPGVSWPATIEPQQTVLLYRSFYPGPQYSVYTGAGGIRRRPDGTIREVAKNEVFENIWYLSKPMLNANWYIQERIDDRNVSLSRCRAVYRGSYIFGNGEKPYHKKDVYFQKNKWKYPYPEIPNVA